LGQWAITLVFGLLSAAFFFRFVQNGWKWMRHVVEGDANFKALTIWCLIYVIVCAGIAAAAFFLFSGGEEDPAGKPSAETK
jgi:hypothetical protein